MTVVFYQICHQQLIIKDSELKLYIICIKIKKWFLFSSLKIFGRKTISKKSFINTKLVLSVNSGINYTKIIEFLKKNNFELVDFVTNAGEYSKRGEIIDIFSPLSNYPVRVFFSLWEYRENKKNIN